VQYCIINSHRNTVRGCAYSEEGLLEKNAKDCVCTSPTPVLFIGYLCQKDSVCPFEV